MTTFTVTIDEVLTYQMNIDARTADEAQAIALRTVEKEPAIRDAALIARTNVEVVDIHRRA
ncbi:hypothetical protein [Burkholderia sp. BE12]|uniref:hypothetical protein n=1 Tax=Burkholderia sp. BE12 TaxID=2082394 RepID=UPI000CF38C29|nr:hypothetical protein [Burkholderia sp. BE12]